MAKSSEVFLSFFLLGFGEQRIGGRSREWRWRTKETAVVVRCCGGVGEGNGRGISMERSTEERREKGDSVLDLDPKSGVAGGVQDVYGEDQATEEQFITPWTVSVAR